MCSSARLGRETASEITNVRDELDSGDRTGSSFAELDERLVQADGSEVLRGLQAWTGSSSHRDRRHVIQDDVDLLFPFS